MQNINKLILPFLLISASLPGCHKEKPSTPSFPVDFCHDPLMKEILNKIQEEYVEKPDERRMHEGAINGMLSALDPYSNYMNQETYELFKESTVGEFSGIGVEVLFMEDSLRVIAPIDDTPAARAGLQHGDYIVKVDDEPINSFTRIKLFKKLHGKPGSVVKLAIQRGDQDTFDLTLERAVITINPIKYKRENDIAYIRISYFNEKTTEKLKEAIQAVQKEGSLNGIILDLRNNPGGTLDQAVSVTSLFVNKGKIVEVRSRDARKNMVYESNVKREILPNVPLIVLVNSGSASASEIVAGALKDHKRAIILGKTTLGKGSVQGLFSLNGRGAIKLTISRFYTPQGHEIQGKGITPDIVVEAGRSPSRFSYSKTDRLIADDDQQLNRAFDMLKGITLLKGR